MPKIKTLLFYGSAFYIGAIVAHAYNVVSWEYLGTLLAIIIFTLQTNN